MYVYIYVYIFIYTCIYIFKHLHIIYIRANRAEPASRLLYLAPYILGVLPKVVEVKLLDTQVLMYM